MVVVVVVKVEVGLVDEGAFVERFGDVVDATVEG